MKFEEFILKNIKTGETTSEIKEIANKAKENTSGFLKSNEEKFWITGEDIEMDNEIIYLINNLPKDIHMPILKKYTSIKEKAKTVRNILRDLIPEKHDKFTNEKILEIKNTLWFRAKDLLIKFSEIVSKQKEDMYNLSSEIFDDSYSTEKIHETWDNYSDVFYKKIADQRKELMDKLDRINEEVLLFADVYKSFAESGEKIDIETIASTHIKILSKKEKHEQGNTLWAITKENRKSFIKEEEIFLREKRFKETLKDSNVDFYCLEYKNKIVAFCSVEKLEDGDMLVESLNTEVEIKGSKVGGSFFKTLIGKIRKEGNIIGYVHKNNSQTLPYYEKLGFKSELVNKEGAEYYKIFLEKSN